MTGRIRSENAAARWSFLPLERGAGKATSFAVAELVHTGIARGTCAAYDELRGRCGTRYDEAADASASKPGEHIVAGRGRIPLASESRHERAGEGNLRHMIGMRSA
jgi:hypothetical protein